MERFEMLAELPLTPVAVEILGGFGEEGMDEKLCMGRATF
jgi:hypothetical protein